VRWRRHRVAISLALMTVDVDSPSRRGRAPSLVCGYVRPDRTKPMRPCVYGLTLASCLDDLANPVDIAGRSCFPLPRLIMFAGGNLHAGALLARPRVRTSTSSSSSSSSSSTFLSSSLSSYPLPSSLPSALLELRTPRRPLLLFFLLCLFVVSVEEHWSQNRGACCGGRSERTERSSAFGSSPSPLARSRTTRSCTPPEVGSKRWRHAPATMRGWGGPTAQAADRVAQSECAIAMSEDVPTRRARLARAAHCDRARRLAGRR